MRGSTSPASYSIGKETRAFWRLDCRARRAKVELIARKSGTQRHVACESDVVLSPEAEEKRGAPRYPLERLAKIQLGQGIPPRYCLITDISGGGVRINVFGYGAKLPNNRDAATQPSLRPFSHLSSGQLSSNSSVTTLNRANRAGPNVVEIATSAASLPRATTIRPIRGRLCLASKTYQRPPKKTSNQALKSIGAGQVAPRYRRDSPCSNGREYLRIGKALSRGGRNPDILQRALHALPMRFCRLAHADIRTQGGRERIGIRPLSAPNPHRCDRK